METLKFTLRILNELKGLFLLVLCLLSSSLFLLFKDDNSQVYKYPDDDPLTHPYFCDPDSFFGQWCLSDVELTRNTYMYFAIQEGIFVVIALYIFFNIKRFPMAHLVFVIINVIALLDYLTSYQKTWFYISTIPISWNVLKVTIFALAIINETLLLVEERLMENRHG